MNRTVNCTVKPDCVPQTAIGIRDGPETQPSIIDDDEDDHGASDMVDRQVRSVGK